MEKLFVRRPAALDRGREADVNLPRSGDQRSPKKPATGFAGSKAKAMDPEIAGNQNYDDHYANDSEDVHSALLPFHDDSARRARSPYVSAAIKLLASFRHRWLGSTEASKYKSFLSPPPISPIAAPSEEQKDHEDNKNEIHSFLQNFWREISLLHIWVQNNYSLASDST
jgi:hypothetical protein